MNWEAIGAIGEIVGALAVFGTLLYLALQVKQVQSDIHVSSIRDANQQFGNIFNSISTSPDLAGVLVKANERASSLEPWEIKLLDSHLNAQVTAWETVFAQIDSGTLKGYQRQDVISLMGRHLDEPWVPAAWNRTKKYHLQDVQGLVESQIQGRSPQE